MPCLSLPKSKVRQLGVRRLNLRRIHRRTVSNRPHHILPVWAGKHEHTANDLAVAFELWRSWSPDHDHRAWAKVKAGTSETQGMVDPPGTIAGLVQRETLPRAE